MGHAEIHKNLGDRQPVSSIAKRSIESGHRINTSDAFNVLFKRNRGKSSRYIDDHLVSINDILTSHIGCDINFRNRSTGFSKRKNEINSV